MGSREGEYLKVLLMTLLFMLFLKIYINKINTRRQ